MQVGPLLGGRPPLGPPMLHGLPMASMYPPSIGGYNPISPFGGVGMGGYPGLGNDPYGYGYGYAGSGLGQYSYYDPTTGYLVDDDPGLAWSQGYYTGANSVQNYTLAMSMIGGGGFGRRGLLGCRRGLPRSDRDLLRMIGYPGVGGYGPWG